MIWIPQGQAGCKLHSWKAYKDATVRSCGLVASTSCCAQKAGGVALINKNLEIETYKNILTLLVGLLTTGRPASLTFASYLSARSQISFKGAMSPSMLNAPSVAMRRRRLCCTQNSALAYYCCITNIIQYLSGLECGLKISHIHVFVPMPLSLA